MPSALDLNEVSHDLASSKYGLDTAKPQFQTSLVDK